MSGKVEIEESPVGASEVHAAARRGLKRLFTRQVLIQVLSFSGGIVLARTLTPEVFGVFGIATFFVGTLAVFGDFGLAPSLVQRKRDLTEGDLQVAFTLQQGLLSLVAVLIWVSAPYFAGLYSEFGGTEILWLIRAMSLTIFLQSWRTMSVLQMERRLEFQRIAWIEVAEVLAYQGLAVGMAVAGFGVWALVWATIARSVLGSVLAFLAAPWPIRMRWDRAKVHELLKFGLPFQTATVMNSARGWVTPLLVGTMIGPAAVGWLTWASANGRKPNLLTGIVARVAFPHFARCQDDRKSLLHAYERYLWILLLVGGWWIAMMFCASTDAVELIYTSKWLPAVPALKVFAVAMALNMVGWVSGAALRGTGKVRYHAAVTGMTSLLILLIAVPLIPLLGFIAVPIATLLALIFDVVALTRSSGLNAALVVVPIGIRIALCTAVASLAGFALRSVGADVFQRMILAVGASTTIYAAAAFLICPPWIVKKAAEEFESLWFGMRQHLPQTANVRGDQ